MTRLTGFTELHRQFEEADVALKAVDGTIATIRFDPNDPTSIDTAVRSMEDAIDSAISPYGNNPLVASVARQMKRKYESFIREKAHAFRPDEDNRGGVEQVTNNHAFDADLFTEIDNAIRDLRGSNYQNYERPLKRLARLMHSPNLEEIHHKLTDKVDFDAFEAASSETGGSMVGSHKLAWPEDREQEFGLTLVLIDRMAANPGWAANFATQYFYSGSGIVDGLHALTAQVLSPFSRDFRKYVVGKSGAQIAQPQAVSSRKVFIVHGHDEGLRESVARFFERIDFEPIILHEQASLGMTISEKLATYGNVGFAVVLLTPDDLGRTANDTELRARARQNVILELGYFVGRLGRDHVCALKRGDIEIPSDYVGVAYTTFDEAGAWKTALGQELQAVGYSLDWNKVMAR